MDIKDEIYGSSTIGLELDKIRQKDEDFDKNLTHAESRTEVFGEQNLDDFQALFIALVNLSKNAIVFTLKIKDILDKLRRDFEYEKLSKKKSYVYNKQKQDFDIVKNEDIE